MGKINGKVILVFFWLLIIGLLVYSRFINLGWGLPYPMHPDERNMVTAILQLNCQPPIIELNLPKSILGNWEPTASWIKIIKPFDLFECFNPHFFAYGQFPLYLGYLITYLFNIEAIISLRIISAVVSVLNVFVLLKIIELFYKPKSKSFEFVLYALIFTLSPYAIQFAHFGTTESLLMLFYSTVIYFSLLFLDKKISTLSFVVSNSLLVGLSLATKVSSMIFLIVPFSVLLFHKDSLRLKSSVLMSKNSIIFFIFRFVSKIIDLFTLIWLSLIIFIIFSPHNFINFRDFIGSMNYESDVALGRSLVFYTRQFFNTQPILFQLEKVFPYTLGWPVYIMGLIGFMSLDWTNRKTNLLRFGFLVYFIPSAIIYAKWSRFIAPIFPIMTIFAILFLQNIISRLNKKLWIPAFAGMTLIMIIPGISYLHIYQNPDVRFQASEWIYKNIPNNSYILSETANVVDIPMSNGTKEQSSNYNVVSFNFYELDEIVDRQSELKDHIQQADYIFVPSRRIFENHPKQKYPILNKYYEDLFFGKLGFEKVKEFESYPSIKFSIFNFQFSKNFPDEQAEETWTVFDHPVIRIYKKISNLK